jgi:outer membrane protein
MQKIFVVGIVVSVLLSAVALATVFSGPRNIVFVDVYKVYNEFKKKKELEKDFDKVKVGQKAILDSLKIEVEMLKRKYDNSTGKDAQMIKDQIDQGSLKYQRLLQGFENSNAAQSKKYNEQILNELNEDIREFGKEKGYDYVMGANGNGAMMYAKDKYDISDDVIKYVNKKYDGK